MARSRPRSLRRITASRSRARISRSLASDSSSRSAVPTASGSERSTRPFSTIEEAARYRVLKSASRNASASSIELSARSLRALPTRIARRSSSGSRSMSEAYTPANRVASRSRRPASPAALTLASSKCNWRSSNIPRSSSQFAARSWAAALRRLIEKNNSPMMRIAPPRRPRILESLRGGDIRHLLESGIPAALNRHGGVAHGRSF